MKIEIEIPEGSVGKDVAEILRTVSEEDKKQIAREIMSGWIKDNLHKDERAIREKEEVERVLARKEHYGPKNESEVRAHYSFAEGMRGWRSTKEKMVEEISGQLLGFFKESVKELLDKDPLVSEMRKEVVAIVRESFPKLTHDALIAWFAGHMNDVMVKVMDASVQVQNLDQFKMQVADRLSQVSQRVGLS